MCVHHLYRYICMYVYLFIQYNITYLCVCVFVCAMSIYDDGYMEIEAHEPYHKFWRLTLQNAMWQPSELDGSLKLSCSNGVTAQATPKTLVYLVSFTIWSTKTTWLLLNLFNLSQFRKTKPKSFESSPMATCISLGRPLHSSWCQQCQQRPVSSNSGWQSAVQRTWPVFNIPQWKDVKRTQTLSVKSSEFENQPIQQICKPFPQIQPTSKTSSCFLASFAWSYVYQTTKIISTLSSGQSWPWGLKPSSYSI